MPGEHPTALLDQVVAAHGGADRFAAVREIVWHVETGGVALPSKRGGRRVPPFEARMATDRPHTVVSPFPGPGRLGVFDGAGDVVRIETDDGAVMSERAAPRAGFSRPRRAVRWDDLDVLYFAGYALWAYATAPFCFTWPGFDVSEIAPFAEGPWLRRRLAVTFGPGVPAHSAEQVFHIDDAGLIRRNDYTAEVFGGWAKAAHYVDEYRRVDGLMVAARRRVYPRRPDGRPRPFPTLVSLDVSGVRTVTR
jgi:hypothetical protein